MDEQAVKKLTDALRGGSDFETAVAFSGLPMRDVLDYVARGQLESERRDSGLPANEAESEAVTLWREVYRARAEAIVRATAQIQKAAQQGDWKAAAWWLERNVADMGNLPRVKNTRNDTWT